MTTYNAFDEPGNLQAFTLGCIIGITDGTQSDEKKIKRIEDNLERYKNRKKELEQK